MKLRKLKYFPIVSDTSCKNGNLYTFPVCLESGIFQIIRFYDYKKEARYMFIKNLKTFKPI